MALEDWAKYLDQYSVADGREQLKDLSAAAEDILIALTKYSPDLGSADAARCAALINILVYLQRQLSRFIRSGEESCDLLAWIARNILETRLWVQYLLEDSANFERFLRETEIDARELFERIGEYRQNAGKTDDNFAALAESLRERHGQLGHPSKRVKFSVSPSDSLIYKHLSKHVHATAWLINPTVRPHRVGAESQTISHLRRAGCSRHCLRCA